MDPSQFARFLRRAALRLGLLTLCLVAASVGIAPPPADAQAALVVHDEGLVTAADCDASAPAFTSIQAAVNAAAPGDTVIVCPGTWDEQVVVTTSGLTLRGSGVGQTIVRPSAVSVNSTGTGAPFPVAAIVLVSGATEVTIRDLTVDGSLASGGAANGLDCRAMGIYAGIYYRLSSGAVLDTHVTKIRSASTCSLAVFVASGVAGETHLRLIGNRLDNYGDAGLNCAGPNSTCIVTGNTAQGRGRVADQIQAGLIFRGGAGGDIACNTITDHFYAPAVGLHEFSVGVALFQAEAGLNGGLLEQNGFAGNQLNVQRYSTEKRAIQRGQGDHWTAQLRIG